MNDPLIMMSIVMAVPILRYLPGGLKDINNLKQGLDSNMALEINLVNSVPRIGRS
jgi:hypothetical protein